MDPERKGKLNEIDFEFNLKAMKDEENWNLQFKKLRDYDETHGHCELFWAVDCFAFTLNTPTYTPPISLPELQAMCHGSIRKTRHWPLGSSISVHASKMAEWIRNEKLGLRKLVSILISISRTSGIYSSRSCVIIL
jgi:hypothetical protein